MPKFAFYDMLVICLFGQNTGFFAIVIYARVAVRKSNRTGVVSPFIIVGNLYGNVQKEI